MSDEEKIISNDKRKFDKNGNLKDSAEKSISEENYIGLKRKEAEEKTNQEYIKAIAEQAKSAIDNKSMVEETKNINESKDRIGSIADKSSTFAQFILSLYTTILISLGEVPDPITGEKSIDSDQAKDLIDIISMLKEKTSGNLTAEEINVLNDVIYQVRMLYLKNVSGIKK